MGRQIKILECSQKISFDWKVEWQRTEPNIGVSGEVELTQSTQYKLGQDFNDDDNNDDVDDDDDDIMK